VDKNKRLPLQPAQYFRNLCKPLKGRILLFLPSFNGRVCWIIAEEYFVTSIGNSIELLLRRTLDRSVALFGKNSLKDTKSQRTAKP
jgi:hypothetical protein